MTNTSEPRTIRFETMTCSRCGGKGRKSDGGWGANHGGACYKCHTAGTVLTENGRRAMEALETMKNERLGVNFGDLANGEIFKYEGKCYRKGECEWLTLGADLRVLRHHGATTRQMWREIASKYKGAELVY